MFSYLTGLLRCARNDGAYLIPLFSFRCFHSAIFVIARSAKHDVAIILVIAGSAKHDAAIQKTLNYLRNNPRVHAQAIRLVR